MTHKEFQAAFEIAKQGAPVSFQDIGETFDGFGLSDFQPVTVTLEQVASLIVWQAAQFGGGWDSAALDEIRTIGRRKFLIAG